MRQALLSCKMLDIWHLWYTRFTSVILPHSKLCARFCTLGRRIRVKHTSQSFNVLQNAHLQTFSGKITVIGVQDLSAFFVQNTLVRSVLIVKAKAQICWKMHICSHSNFPQGCVLCTEYTSESSNLVQNPQLQTFFDKKAIFQMGSGFQAFCILLNKTPFSNPFNWKLSNCQILRRKLKSARKCFCAQVFRQIL